MKLFEVILCLFVVILVSLGQVLLRIMVIGITADTLVGRLLCWRSVLAFSVYGVAMLMWLYVLSRVPVSSAFAFFGLSFFLVPLFSNLLLGDPVKMMTWLGAVVISLGIVISSW